MGLKTTYYLRTLAKSTVEKSTLDIANKYDGAKAASPTPSNAGQPEKTMLASGVSSACLIEDPTCEACQ